MRLPVSRGKCMEGLGQDEGRGVKAGGDRVKLAGASDDQVTKITSWQK